jgi:hypothetical protein
MGVKIWSMSHYLNDISFLDYRYKLSKYTACFRPNIDTHLQLAYEKVDVEVPLIKADYEFNFGEFFGDGINYITCTHNGIKCIEVHKSNEYYMDVIEFIRRAFKIEIDTGIRIKYTDYMELILLYGAYTVTYNFLCEKDYFAYIIELSSK